MKSMKKHIIAVAFLAMFSLTIAMGQSKITHGVSIKKTFVDYHTLNGGDVFDFQDWNGGFEVGYAARLNDKWGLSVPIRVAEITLPESVYNQRFIGADVQAQYSFLGRLKKVNPYVAAGAGFMTENGDNGHVQIPLGLGLQIKVGPMTDINAELAYRLGLEDDRDNLNLGIGFVHYFGKVPMEGEVMVEEEEIVDSDGDGIADDVDLCPQVPGLEAFFGCPDTDGDGIQDDRDDCPEQPGDRAMNGCPDSDNDGVSDKDDECPNLPGTIANNGCPEEELKDTDGDGILDRDDRCPNERGPARNLGCPEVVQEPDTDGDGILDRDDRCPNERGTAANQGCPEVVRQTVRDRDGDGVDDSIDGCPDQAGPAYLNGCPDTDGDGVADFEDECPNAPGPRNAKGCPDTDGDGVSDKIDRCINTPGPASNLGCPDLKKEDRETLEFAVQAVEFDFGKATLRPESFDILNRIADIMKRYPEYELRISGFTDNVGAASRNRDLSERRARSCYEYLSSRGVPVSRMSYVGMGEERPIADNETESGRSKNRRVEFDVYVR